MHYNYMIHKIHLGMWLVRKKQSNICVDSEGGFLFSQVAETFLSIFCKTISMLHGEQVVGVD